VSAERELTCRTLCLQPEAHGVSLSVLSKSSVCLSQAVISIHSSSLNIFVSVSSNERLCCLARKINQNCIGLKWFEFGLTSHLTVKLEQMEQVDIGLNYISMYVILK